MRARLLIMSRLLGVLALARGLVVALACMIGGPTAASEPPAVAGSGHVDKITVDSRKREIVLEGWAAPTRPNAEISFIAVNVGRQEVYRGSIERSERPDVATATGRQDWLHSGWRIAALLPGNLPAGEYPLAVRVSLTDGAEFSLGVPEAVRRIQLGALRSRSPAAVLLVVLAAVIPAVAFVWAESVAVRLRSLRSLAVVAPAVFGVAIAASFLLLVASGVTGSSLEIGLGSSPATNNDSVRWTGRLQPVRIDEWVVFTPMAVAQVTHAPRFPIINENIGLSGQNMLVIGMTGVPVLHLSALVRPATWGYFFVDLPRALSWHWWFPFFSCFAALWALVIRVFGIDWRMSAALAFTFTAGPYAICWSGWPAYSVFFPAVGVLAADLALRARSWAIALLAGAALGLSLAGFALLLYPAWQVSLGYLFLFLFIGLVVRDRHDLALRSQQVAAACIATVFAAAVLIVWWLDARDAVGAILETAYPGRRALVSGGDVDSAFLVKGLTNVITLYREATGFLYPSEAGSFVNQSEAGSFVYLLLPLGAGVVLSWIAARRVDSVSLAIVLFGLIVLSFQFLGFTVLLAEYSLWGRSTPNRADIALGLAQLFLFAYLISLRRPAAVANDHRSSVIAFIAAGAWALFSLYLLRRVPSPVSELLTPGLVVVSVIAVGATSFLLLTRRFAAFVGLYSSWVVGMSLMFNPLGEAPRSVSVGSLFSTLTVAELASIHRGRVVVFESQVPAMMLVAAGQPVLNGVHYYPQTALWRALDPDRTQGDVYNRYQHLLFTVGRLPSAQGHRIESPRLDAVMVIVDPKHFDFRLLGVDYILAPEQQSVELLSSKALERVTGRDGWALLRLKK